MAQYNYMISIVSQICSFYTHFFPVTGVELPIIGEAPGSDERTGKKKPSEDEVIDSEEGEEDSDSPREF